MSTVTECPLTIRQTKLLINGKLVASQSGKTFPTINPATEEVIAEIAEGGAADIDLAVKAARQALESGPWSRMPARERGRLMYKLADLIDEHAEELGKLEALDTGKPVAAAMGYDVPGSAATIRYFAGWADKLQGKTIPTSGPFNTYTRREPVGVCGLIVPWNYPISLACWKLGAMLAAGCTGVLKPAELSPLTALRLADLIAEAGFPDGVVNIVPGFGTTAGAALVEHPDVDKIAFTGDFKTAQVIKAATSQTMKRLTCELGGKSPNIIFADADFDAAVQGAIGGIFSNNGQNCCAGSRIFVQDAIYDRFVDAFAKQAQSLKVGNPFEASTDQGALIDQRQFDKVMHYIALGKEQGARCVAGGKRVGSTGYFVEPTVFADVTDEMAIATDEIFGPVASILKFSELDEVIQRANNTSFGLAAAVWTQNLTTAHAVTEQVRAGTVWVNTYNAVDAAGPFGGFKNSGIGRDLGEAALDGYTETKTVTMNVGYRT